MRVRVRGRTIVAVVAAAGILIAAPAGASPTTSSTSSTSTSTPVTSTPVTSTPVRLATPLLSVRRLPGWIEASAAGTQIAAGLPGLMAKLGPEAHSSCLDVSQAGITIYASNATQEETPASNLKLLTLTAVLDKIGPDARIRTVVTRTGRLVHGVLHGNLYLVGGGDPFLRTSGYVPDEDLPEPVTTSLPQLAAQVKAAGITKIDGDVIGDAHLFNADLTVPTWKASYSADDDVGPLSALDVNDGFSPTKPWAASSQPAVTAAKAFAGLLRNDGIKIPAQVATQGVSPRSAHRVTSILSAPISSIVKQILTVSDDTGAELLTKLLGKRFAGVGSTAAGVRVIKRDLAADGFPTGSLHMFDGSGLDDSDQVTCQLVLDVLQRAGTKGPIFAGLPVAGETGTLNDRMNGTVAQGRIHAKTGTLNTVSSLSGFVMPEPKAKASTAQTGAPIAFSFISNNLPGDYLGIEVGDDIGTYLAGVKTKIPPLSAASPLPDLRRG
jgi:serine-type D-Ala-D-Ala carboxypeptidase/endopeptidase (penicillin-binding protein 4)